MKNKDLLLLCLAASWLTSCGGGGGSGGATSSTPAAPAPTATISSSAANVIKGDPLTITWSSTNATSCTASGSWSGSLATSGSQTVATSTTGAATYGISCSGGGGSATAEAKVAIVDKATATISSSATNAMKGDTVTLTWNSTSTSGCTASGGWSGTIAASGNQAVSVGSTGSVAFAISCNGAGGTATAETKINSYERVAINLALSRPDVITYQASTLSWSVTNADSCTASGAWSGTKALTGSLTISTTAEATNTYIVTCTNAGGSIQKSATLKVSSPPLSFAGTWAPVPDADISSKYNGTLANTFNGIVKAGSDKFYGVVTTGWSFSGFGNEAAISRPARVNAALFSPDSSGVLKLVADKLTPDATTNGGGSVVIADFNSDSYDDIVLLAHNESPFIALPSTVFWGSASGKFTKDVLDDKVMAHDAQLVIINGQKRVMTGTFTAVKNDKGEWVRQVDAMSNPIYYFESGKLKARESPALRGPTLPSASGMTNTYVRGANGTPDKLVGGEGSIANAAGQCCDTRTTVFNFDGWDIIPSQLTQSFMPYLGTIDKYKNIVSLNGPGVPHVYRAYAKDLNNDGYDDLLLAQSLWSETSKDFPSALQVLLNNGRGTFSDATDLLNPDLPQATEELGYTPTFIDIDNSGIETILWNGSSSYSGVARLSDYVLLNDGTGRLYSALPDAFKNSGKAIKDFLRAQGLNYNDSVPPRFIAVPQPDGSLNFLAESGGIRLNANVNVSQLVYHYVNSGFRYDPRNDFTQTVSISDRRQSVRIRTWAGDDTISDKNAAKATTIDGGLGANKATYSGPSTAYSVVKNADGTSTVTTTVSGSYPSVKDTLKNIQTIQFTDKSVTLSARARLN